VIAGLEALKRPCTVRIHTDSKYVMTAPPSGFTAGKRNGWRTADKKPVKKRRAVAAPRPASAPHKLHWTWVKAQRPRRNERADVLARSEIAKLRGR